MLEQLEHVGEDGAAEGAEMEQDYVVDVVAVDEFGHGAIGIDVGGGGAEVAGVEGRDGLGVVLVEAAGVGGVPKIVFPVDGDLGDFVVALGQEVADGAAFLDGVAFDQVGVAEPVPVLERGLGVRPGGGQELEGGLVLLNILFELLDCAAGKIDVGVGVVADGFVGGPEFEGFGTVVVVFRP